MTQSRGQGPGNRPPPGQSGRPPGGPPPPATAAPRELPDLPPVPRAKMSFFAKTLLGFGVLTVGGYAVVAMTGWTPAQPARDEVPASVRSSPGGYRSYHFWHSGYRGGK